MGALEVVLIDDVVMLMVLFCLKHFLADFPLQGKYMLGKFKEKGWVLPLGAHCMVHAVFTFAISYMFLYEKDWAFKVAYNCACLDFLVHFAMDRIKASPHMLGRFKNFTKDGYDFITHGYHPPNLAQVELSNCGQYDYGLTLKTLEPGDEKKLFRSNTYFWWALGFDQLVHNLTDVAVIYILVSNS